MVGSSLAMYSFTARELAEQLAIFARVYGHGDVLSKESSGKRDYDLVTPRGGRSRCGSKARPIGRTSKPYHRRAYAADRLGSLVGYRIGRQDKDFL